MDFNEARDDEVAQWLQLNSPYVSHVIITPASHHSIAYRPKALPDTQPTLSKH